MSDSIKVIDLFAGPGGLGEGFSAYRSSSEPQPFRIALSIENDAFAHATLTLRAFLRQFPADRVPDEYYAFLSGGLGSRPEDGLLELTRFRHQADAARTEARRLTLGEDTREINKAIAAALGHKPGPWVLIGGPPCQAYSLVGRSRNKGITDYRPESDRRNFLYREYLRVLSRFTPDAFVMENVKGMLSANVNGGNVFRQILQDLECPARALRSGDKRVEYRTIALGVDGKAPDLFGHSEPEDFVIRSERFGVPQARHRVIIVGVRADRLDSTRLNPLSPAPGPTIEEAICDLPRLRSGLSREPDSLEAWVRSVAEGARKTAKAVAAKGDKGVAERIRTAASEIGESGLGRGSNWAVARGRRLSRRLAPELRDWYLGGGGSNLIVNHDTRGHRADDLQRYLFCACFADCASGKITPNRKDFPEALYPDHRSWAKGGFADRFRVQARARPATTVTSHISKDGHYFVHYDPTQCRSLTVREAARVQTFPDNYFFVGPRTEQYKQVGNAVPPYLARQLAEVVLGLVRR